MHLNIRVVPVVVHCTRNCLDASHLADGYLVFFVRSKIPERLTPISLHTCIVSVVIHGANHGLDASFLSYDTDVFIILSKSDERGTSLQL